MACWYLQVVLSYGAESDRKLNIPGEVSRQGCQCSILSAASSPSSCCQSMALPGGRTQGSVLHLLCSTTVLSGNITWPYCLTPLQDSKGVYAAREFVWWYNGHPDQQHLPIDLTNVESVALCGIGNVALDCARVLLRPVEQLASTDIAQHALQQLRQSKVRTVQLCARRGPVQVRIGSTAGRRHMHSL